MRSNFKVLAFFFMVAGLIWAGCQTNVPVQPVIVPAGDRNLVVTITATTAKINTGLYVGGVGQSLGVPPALSLSYAASVNITNPPVTLGFWKGVPVTCTGSPCMAPVANSAMTEVSSGMPQNPYAVQVTGLMNDPEDLNDPPGPGQYDSIGITIWPGQNSTGFYQTPPITSPAYGPQKGYYDLSPFQGIQFYFRVSSGDTSSNRAFSLATAQNIPAPNIASYINPNGGLCGAPSRPDLTGCYDSWSLDLTTVPRDQWIFVQKSWPDFHMGGYGSAPVPPSLSGENLEQFQSFTFSSSNGAAAGPVSVNFSFTGMKFF